MDWTGLDDGLDTFVLKPGQWTICIELQPFQQIQLLQIQSPAITLSL